MTDPDTGRRTTTVTIKSKQSEKYAADGSWFVFHGAPEEIIADIGTTFGIDIEGLSLFDATVNAEQIVRGVTNVARGLGASVLSSGGSSDDVWAQAAAAQAGQPATPTEEPKVDAILAALEAATTVADVQQVWAENQSAFNGNDSYMEAYRARGRALSGK